MLGAIFSWPVGVQAASFTGQCELASVRQMEVNIRHIRYKE